MRIKKTKVLIVEDEIVVAMDIKGILESLDCEVTGIVQTQKKF